MLVVTSTFNRFALLLRFAGNAAAPRLASAVTSRARFSADDNGDDVSAARCSETDSTGRRDRSPKMRFIHQRRQLNKGEIVQLDCDTQCNFMLLTDDDYVAYQQVRRFRYCGGTFKHFPARVTVPESGNWNIIIDLAGANGEIQYNITIIVD